VILRQRRSPASSVTCCYPSCYCHLSAYPVLLLAAERSKASFDLSSVELTVIEPAAVDAAHLTRASCYRSQARAHYPTERPDLSSRRQHIRDVISLIDNANAALISKPTRLKQTQQAQRSRTIDGTRKEGVEVRLLIDATARFICRAGPCGTQARRRQSRVFLPIWRSHSSPQQLRNHRKIAYSIKNGSLLGPKPC